MNESIAVGGPLNGVKLVASGTWNGRVERDLSGAYRWDVITSSWTWRELAVTLKPRIGRPSKVKIRK